MLIIIRDILHLYQTMAEMGESITTQELANATNTNERHTREWLANHVARGYIIYAIQKAGSILFSQNMRWL
jgi:MarR-like DNA-binding transcriptional regulator SgrR of sgrS sRNA